MTTSTRTEAEQPPPLLNADRLYPPDVAPAGPGPAARERGSGLPEGRVGGWFADLAAGVDTGRPVHCTACRAPLSQPRIDHGLNTCPACRVPARSPKPSRA